MYISLNDAILELFFIANQTYIYKKQYQGFESSGFQKLKYTKELLFDYANGLGIFLYGIPRSKGCQDYIKEPIHMNIKPITRCQSCEGEDPSQARLPNFDYMLTDKEGLVYLYVSMRKSDFDLVVKELKSFSNQFDSLEKKSRYPLSSIIKSIKSFIKQ